MDTAPAKTPSPPYIPFKTLTNWLEKIEPKGLPPVIDKSLLTSMAGGQRQPFLASLKWLGLIDQDGTVQPMLKQLVAAKSDDRKALLRTVIESKYGWISTLTSQNATLQQLEKSFEDKGPSGSTLRKCIVFYLEAAEFAGIPVSAHFKVRGYISKAGRSTPRAPKQRTDGSGIVTPIVPGPTTAATSSAETLKIKYIEMLMKKADEKDDPDLLDRIEKLLGTSTKEVE